MTSPYAASTGKAAAALFTPIAPGTDFAVSGAFKFVALLGFDVFVGCAIGATVSSLHKVTCATLRTGTAGLVAWLPAIPGSASTIIRASVGVAVMDHFGRRASLATVYRSHVHAGASLLTTIARNGA
jgi:hypothetical protein